MATGDVITHDQLIEDGAFDPAQEGAKALNDIIGILEDSFISFGTSAKEAIKWANPDNLTVEGYKKLTDQLDTMNTVTEQSVKTDKLKAQSLKALADQEKANTTILKQKAAQEKANTDAQAKSIVLTKEQIAQKQLDAAKDREAIALIKAKMAASNEALGTTQRIAAANAVLRNEQKNLNLTTAEGVARNGEINKQLDINNGTIKKNADALKQQAMNVGNYSKSFTKSLRPLEELVRGLGYAMGVPIEGLREYTGVIRGATELNHHHKESLEGVKEATEGESKAQKVQLDAEGNVIEAKVADIAVTEEQAAAQEAAIPIIGWVIAGTLALGAAIAIAIEATEAHRKALTDRSHAMDGVVFYDEKVRASYEDDLIIIQKVTDSYKELNGSLSDTQASLNEMSLENKRSLNDISNDTKGKIDESMHSWKRFFSMWVSGGEWDASQNDRLKIQNEADAQSLEETLKYQEKMLDLYKDEHVKMREAVYAYNEDKTNSRAEVSKARIAMDRDDYEREKKPQK